MKALIGVGSLAVFGLAASAAQPSVGPLPTDPATPPVAVAPAIPRAATPARAVDPRSTTAAATSRPASVVVRPARRVAVEAHASMVRRIAQRHAVEWRLVMAIIASESGGDPFAVSPVGAVGLMQLMPGTASDLGVDPWDPEQNVDGAVRYLSTLLSTFGSVDLSLVAYNAGPEFARRYRDGVVELGAETRAFLMRVDSHLR
jgi:soluble lytic murein transglycosylase-like protein